MFAAASLTESLTAIGDKYMAENKNVKISFNFDSSGKLLTQIEEGAVCDLFISAAPKQMNALDGSLKDNSEKNPKGQDLLVTGSRIDLLENKVALAVAEGNPKDIDSFDKLADLLKNGDVKLAIGNSDVPVSQYTQKIFKFYSIDEAAIANKLTYGLQRQGGRHRRGRGHRGLQHHLCLRCVFRQADRSRRGHRRYVRPGHLSRRRSEYLHAAGCRRRSPAVSPERRGFRRV